MKGFVKTLEAGIATIFILTFVLIFFAPQPQPEPQILINGYNCLKYLDYTGALGYYAANNLESSLDTDLKKCLPPTMSYEARICKTPSCTTQLPEGKTVFLSSYIILGENSATPFLINLWVWST